QCRCIGSGLAILLPFFEFTYPSLALFFFPFFVFYFTQNSFLLVTRILPVPVAAVIIVLVLGRGNGTIRINQQTLCSHRVIRIDPVIEIIIIVLVIAIPARTASLVVISDADIKGMDLVYSFIKADLLSGRNIDDHDHFLSTEFSVFADSISTSHIKDAVAVSNIEASLLCFGLSIGTGAAAAVFLYFHPVLVVNTAFNPDLYIGQCKRITCEINSFSI